MFSSEGGISKNMGQSVRIPFQTDLLFTVSSLTRRKPRYTCRDSWCAVCWGSTVRMHYQCDICDYFLPKVFPLGLFNSSFLCLSLYSHKNNITNTNSSTPANNDNNNNNNNNKQTYSTRLLLDHQLNAPLTHPLKMAS
jgi:hypothetical protein